ncbi:MAG: hypothetical protein ABIP74_02730 [Candidatus Saccharimonas sp.]
MNAATTLLTEWLADGGYLESKYHTYRLTQILHRKNSAYMRVFEKEGEEAADKWLAGWEARTRVMDFAAAVHPIAEGMLALAKSDPEGRYTVATDVTDDMVYPRSDRIGNPSKMVVVFNRQVPGCGCTQPKNSELFGEYGSLGLKAITLQRGYSSFGDMAMVGLILPSRSVYQGMSNPNAFNVLTFDMTGLIDPVQYNPELYANGVLRYAMGLDTLESALSMTVSSGGIADQKIGFPGATSFIADNLPNLVSYLKELASKLSADHTH